MTYYVTVRVKPILWTVLLTVQIRFLTPNLSAVTIHHFKLRLMIDRYPNSSILL
jgi:hypothetical protein